MKVKKIDLDKADVVKQEVCSRDGDACRKERFVIFNEELAGGRARVTTEEVRVQRRALHLQLIVRLLKRRQTHSGWVSHVSGG